MNLFKAAIPFYDAFTADPGTSDLDNEQPLTITVTLGDWRNLRRAMMLADTPAPEARAVNVEGRDFYELCQEYRHAPDYFDAKRGKTASQAFEALKSYITKGELPWPSYESLPQLDDGIPYTMTAKFDDETRIIKGTIDSTNAASKPSQPEEPK